LDEKRKGEIALAIMKYDLTQNDIKLNANDINRRLGNAAKATGIPIEELKEFAQSIVQELVDKAFSK